MQKQQMDWGAAERGGGTQPLFSLLSVCPCFLSVCMSAYLSVCLPACRRVRKVFFFKPSDALPLPPKLTSSPHPLPFYLLITSTFSSLSYFDLQATSLDFSVQFPSLVFSPPFRVSISSRYRLFLLPPRHADGLRRLGGPPTSSHLCLFSQPPLSHPLSSGRP